MPHNYWPVETPAFAIQQSPGRQRDAIARTEFRVDGIQVQGLFLAGDTLSQVIARANSLPASILQYPLIVPPDILTAAHYREVRLPLPLGPPSPYPIDISTAFLPVLAPGLQLDQILYSLNTFPDFYPAGLSFAYSFDWTYFHIENNIVSTPPVYVARRCLARSVPAFPCYIGSAEIYGTRPALTAPIGQVGIRNVVFDQTPVEINSRGSLDIPAPGGGGQLGNVRFLLPVLRPQDFQYMHELLNLRG
jgi:hypothetical protein